ncbi:hypothetical protein ONE63_005593 [Megalurothrips usitatus]|uniref:DNA-(apurinic or apyrimidinic site) endonuclease n=1 Tax=Megalurothrips usitatus TaxID=439358 RepID=A0AAV7XW34_9NEOP|nr:hypothetical protein ONE63_005593 [Megalurothrips usitatus]
MKMIESVTVPSNGFKIVSWNINGIRTVKNLKVMLDEFEADIICLQETKVTRDMIDEPTALVEGYNSYFSFSRARSGYSGVATFCRERATPMRAEEGLSGTLQNQDQSDTVGCTNGIENEFSPQELKRLDSEGRTVITQHKIKRKDGSEYFVSLFNVYCPRADPERPDRIEFKLRFNKLLELRARAVKESGSLVVIVGDINISHRPIDRCENVDPVEFEANPSRQWLNSILLNLPHEKPVEPLLKEGDDNFKIVDSFRYFHPSVQNAYTCWNTMINARATNYGSRIDYIFVDDFFIKDMVDSLILSEIHGSDHCPVAGVFNVMPVKAAKCPLACIKNFPEFTGVQQKLSVFFTKKVDGKNEISEQSISEFTDESVKRKREVIESKPSEFKKKAKAEGRSSQKQISSFFMKKSQSKKDDVNENASVSSSQGSTSSVSEGSSSENIKGVEFDVDTVVEKIERSTSAVSAWKSMLTGPLPPPMCKGHKEPCVERTVKKKGPNFNRKFFACARGEGSKNDPRARCDHFEWALKK